MTLARRVAASLAPGWALLTSICWVGLVFIGGSRDEKFHAFDKSSGKLLWEFKLPAGGYATPCTYMVRNRQYVVIAAGGGGKLGTKSGDAYLAFALPKR